jgi:hypothetical protein
MAAVDDAVELIEQSHLAQGEFVKGNPAHGWEQVAASQFRDGEFVSRDRSDHTDKEYVEIAADIFLSGLRTGR